MDCLVGTQFLKKDIHSVQKFTIYSIEFQIDYYELK